MYDDRQCDFVLVEKNSVAMYASGVLYSGVMYSVIVMAGLIV